MGRLVDPGKVTESGNEVEGDDKYSARLVKYVPTESVAVFLFINTAILTWYGRVPASGEPKPFDTQFWVLSSIVFIVILAGTFFYLFRQKEEGKPWLMNTLVSTAAFVLWAYSIGGALFIGAGLFLPLVAVILAPLFTFAAPIFFKPKP